MIKKKIKQNKKRQARNILVLLLLALTLSSCNNDDDDNQSTNPIDQLPPATQTGANTFGCLLDGNAFLPGNRPLSLDCVYQFVNGGFYFTLQANRRDEHNNSTLLGVITENLEISQNEIYELKENQELNASGVYSFNARFSYTNSINSGELTITKLDMQNQIVSGTFWYDVEDQNGDVHEIREGRFDMQFTL